MTPKHKLLAAAAFIALVPSLLAFRKTDPLPKPAPPRIQVALLLDVSNSMDGLIDQAKAQLWNMVDVLGRAKCERGAPQIEIALYAYGRMSNDKTAGYVKQISPFSSNLDSLSNALFRLTTNGGEEYCPQVIYTAAQDLPWDTTGGTYRAIFIAGNESFRQGTLEWTRACAAAAAKNIAVNTIFCGDRATGISLHWNLGGECGTGSYTHINDKARIEDIPTPYDSALFTLNDRFNFTQISYGAPGAAASVQVREVDRMNYAHNRAAAAKRVAVKGNKTLYRNSSWDLVDAYEDDSTIITRADRSTLPDSLRSKTPAQLKVLVQKKQREREQLRTQVTQLSRQRDAWLAEERRRRAGARQAEATLESEMEKILKQQVQRAGYRIE